MQVLGGPGALAHSFTVLGGAIILKCIAFALFQKRISFVRSILFMLTGNLLTTVIGVVAGAMLSIAQAWIIGLPVVWLLSVLPAKRLIAASQRFAGANAFALAAKMTGALAVSCVAFMLAMAAVDSASPLMYWLFKIVGIYIALGISIVLTAFWEEWVIWRFSRAAATDTGFASPVIRANLLVLLAVSALAAALTLPKRLKSHDFLVPYKSKAEQAGMPQEKPSHQLFASQAAIAPGSKSSSWHYEYKLAAVGTRSEHVVGNLTFNKTTLPKGLGRVVTPIGEFIYVDKVAPGAPPQTNWVPCKTEADGSLTTGYYSKPARELLASKTLRTTSIAHGSNQKITETELRTGFYAGSFHSKPDGTPQHWCHSVTLSYWIDPSKAHLAPDPLILSNGQDPKQLLGEIYQTPIEFYGRVVDEKSNAISGAHIRLNVSDKHFEASTPYERFSDENGFFSFTSVRGAGLSIMALKDGYYTTEKSSLGFTYATNLRERELFPVPLPTPETPAILVLKRKGTPETLVHLSRRSSFPVRKDGSPTQINLAAPGMTPNILRVEAWIFDQTTNTAGRYDWRCSLSSPGGRFAERKSLFEFEAPPHGYQEYFEFAVFANAQSWRRSLQKEFFVHLSDNRFARVSLVLFTHGNPAVTIESFLNPTPGSRNLEEDPSNLIEVPTQAE
jgi:hypothetical protein